MSDPIMTREEVLRELNELSRECPDYSTCSAANEGNCQHENRDWESDHGCADSILLSYINDSEIFEAYSRVGKWYA